MATVYAARDLKHDRPVAIKVLQAGWARAGGGTLPPRDPFDDDCSIPTFSLHDSGDAAGSVWFTMP